MRVLETILEDTFLKSVMRYDQNSQFIPSKLFKKRFLTKQMRKKTKIMIMLAEGSLSDPTPDKMIFFVNTLP